MRNSAFAALVCGSIVGGTAMPSNAVRPDWDARDQVMTCESNEGRLRECAADTRGRVRLVKQLSRSPCIEGRTWGARRDGIWVSEGCRAEFLVGRSRKRDRQADDVAFVRCESRDGRSQHCPARTGGGVELVRQLSRSECIRGRNWGWDERGIWVSGGCRAEFRTERFALSSGDGDVTRVGSAHD